ncbi:MAG: fibronectin type III domain-containing protein [Candidatus Kerfeldbacteria bacterium]|nr:fibronectin type III domain-containing protein [Candidatus Kerfeldbacteria bacterium]
MKNTKVFWRSSMVLVALIAGSALSWHATQARTAEYYVEDGDIALDGDLSDWPADSQVIDETGVDDVTTQTWCWNNDASSWDADVAEEDCTDSFFYDENSQLNLQTAYFGSNETYMYLGFESLVPMMAVLNTSTGEYEDIFTMYLQDGITTLPQAFSHEMVFAYDVDPNTEESVSYDYYLVAVMRVPEDLSSLFTGDEGSSTVTLKMYAENNDEEGYQDSEETDLGDLGNNGETSNDSSGEDTPSTPSVTFEVRVDISNFFETTGITYDEPVLFRIETHSDIGDESDAVDIQFSETGTPDVPTGLDTTNVKKRSAKLLWDAVSGADFYKVELSRAKGETWKKVKLFKQVNKNSKVVGKGFLKADRTYTFRVKACNSTGCSAFSDYTEFATDSQN